MKRIIVLFICSMLTGCAAYHNALKNAENCTSLDQLNHLIFMYPPESFFDPPRGVEYGNSSYGMQHYRLFISGKMRNWMVDDTRKVKLVQTHFSYVTSPNACAQRFIEAYSKYGVQFESGGKGWVANHEGINYEIAIWKNQGRVFLHANSILQRPAPIE